MTPARLLVLALALSGSVAASATAAPIGMAEPLDAVEAESVSYLHSHYHAAHHYDMIHGNHHRDGHAPGHYSHGDGEHHRTTATGGNPGGFSSRN